MSDVSSQSFSLPKRNRLWARIKSSIAARRDRKRTARALRNLPPHALRDIGLKPSDFRLPEVTPGFLF